MKKRPVAVACRARAAALARGGDAPIAEPAPGRGTICAFRAALCREPRARVNVAFDRRPIFVRRQREIVSRLQIQPEPGGGPELVGLMPRNRMSPASVSIASFAMPAVNEVARVERKEHGHGRIGGAPRRPFPVLPTRFGEGRKHPPNRRHDRDRRGRLPATGGTWRRLPKREDQADFEHGAALALGSLWSSSLLLDLNIGGR